MGDKEIYMINEVALPGCEQGIQEQTVHSICVKCGRTKTACVCKK